MLVLAWLACAGGARAADPADSVDPMVGTFAPGFVFPGADVPFGMVQNSPDTYGSPFAYGGYLYSDPLIRGFSLVHLSGPGVQKAGDVPFMPTIGPVTSNDPAQYGSPWSHAREHAAAGYYSVHLDKPQTDVELTTSTHAAMQRYTFPPTPLANVIVDVTRGVDGVHTGQIRFSGKDEVSGFTRSHYPVYFVARFSRPFSSTGVFKSDGDGAGGWVTFDATTNRTVTVRIGISFVDLAGARRNLDAEAPDFDFDRMRRAAHDAWSRALSRIDVSGGSAAARTTFYTALYHAQLHPNVFTDVDGRYLGFDGRPHSANGRTQYANLSLWDTYKAENQLLATIQPGRYRDMLLSLLDDYRLGGTLPRWVEQSFDAAHMSGDPAIPMIADGYCRGLLAPAEASSLYGAALDRVAKRPPDLARLGWLPDNAGTTLEYGVADFSLALLADGLGRGADRSRWLAGAVRYRNVLDPSTKWVRPREADGSWYGSFSPTDEHGFQEGNSWQYSWLAPQDARGLFDRMGGDAAALGRLDHLFSQPPDAQVAQNAFGTQYKTDQYAPGNEHDIQVPWMYAFAREPWRAAEVTRSLRTVFRPTPNGLPGNDDLGGLSGWYVWNALGLSPVTPGAPFYVVGSPAFARAVVTPAGEGSAGFTVAAGGTSDSSQYVRGASLDGHGLSRPWLYASELAGAKLSLSMGSSRSSWGTAASAVPPSLTGSSLARFGCAPAASATDVLGGRRRATRHRSRSRVRIRLAVRPRHARLGAQRVRFRFRATARVGHRRRVAVAHALIRFAGRRVRTNRRGGATLLAPARPGALLARASKRGMRSGKAWVRVMPPLR